MRAVLARIGLPGPADHAAAYAIAVSDLRARTAVASFAQPPPAARPLVYGPHPLQSSPSMKVRLSKTFGFEAAHDLPTFPEGHKCRRLHGHSYRFEVIVEGEVDPKPGYLLDYGEIKKVVDPIVRQLDHYYLNDIKGLENSTSEILAGWLWARIKPSLPMLAKIIVYETCTSACEYCGE